MSDDWSTAVFVGFWLLVLFVAFASPVIRRRWPGSLADRIRAALANEDTPKRRDDDAD